MQLSEGPVFLMTQKHTVKKGLNKGKPIYTVRITKLAADTDQPSLSTFQTYKTFFLSAEQFDAWLVKLVVLSEKRLEGEKVEGKKKP